jgi:hypothetical protein
MMGNPGMMGGMGDPGERGPEGPRGPAGPGAVRFADATGNIIPGAATVDMGPGTTFVTFFDEAGHVWRINGFTGDLLVAEPDSFQLVYRTEDCSGAEWVLGPQAENVSNPLRLPYPRLTWGLGESASHGQRVYNDDASVMLVEDILSVSTRPGECFPVPTGSERSSAWVSSLEDTSVVTPPSLEGITFPLHPVLP